LTINPIRFTVVKINPNGLICPLCMDAGITFQEDFFMKKRIRDLMYLLIVLAVVFTGAACSSNDDDDDDPPPPNPAPTVVVIAAGSYGTAGDTAITDLTDSATYVVSTGGEYFGVAADGSLGSGTTLADAIGEAAALSGYTEIIGLTNGTTYNVYKVVVGSTGASANLDEDAYNTVIDISALTDGNTYIVNADGTQPAAKSVIVYVGQALEALSGDTIATQEFEGSSLDYTLGTTTADGVTFGTLSGGEEEIIFDLSSITGYTFTTTITVKTAD
jgi:hypothetical protein